MGISGVQIYEIPSVELASRGFPLDILKQLHAAGRIDQTTMLRVDLAFQEALANSLEHGNLELISTWKDNLDSQGADLFSVEKKKRLADPQYGSRKIKIFIECTECEIQISITDEGNGFEVEKVIGSQNLEPYGRGLAMIRANMDSVSFADRGRVIKMTKRLHGA